MIHFGKVMLVVDALSPHDPFLEQDQVWRDFHERFCPAAAEVLTPQVRPNYVARIDEHVYLHEMPALPAIDLEQRDEVTGGVGHEIYAPDRQAP